MDISVVYITHNTIKISDTITNKMHSIAINNFTNKTLKLTCFNV